MRDTPMTQYYYSWIVMINNKYTHISIITFLTTFLNMQTLRKANE